MRYYGMFVLALTLGVTSYSDESSIEEITVTATARKSAESLQDAPIALQAVSAEELQGDGIQKIEDLLEEPKGSEFRSFDPAVNRPIIRGLVRGPQVPSSIPEVIDFEGVAVDTLEMMQVTDCITPMLGPIDERDLSQLELIVVDPADYEGVRICPSQ